MNSLPYDESIGIAQSFLNAGFIQEANEFKDNTEDLVTRKAIEALIQDHCSKSTLTVFENIKKIESLKRKPGPYDDLIEEVLSMIKHVEAKKAIDPRADLQWLKDLDFAFEDTCGIIEEYLKAGHPEETKYIIDAIPLDFTRNRCIRMVLDYYVSRKDKSLEPCKKYFKV